MATPLTREHLIQLGMTKDGPDDYYDHPVHVNVSKDSEGKDVFLWWVDGIQVVPHPQNLEDAQDALGKTLATIPAQSQENS